MRDIEFRDGYKRLPDHVADLIAQFPTYQMTYEEALKLMNASFLTDRLRDIQSSVVREHTARYGTE